jgi:effector-binding domain-containing protein
MKILKRIVVILLVLIVLVLIIVAFMPSKRHIEASLTINVPAKVVYEQVANLKNWDKWSPFQEGDTAMEVTYSGPPRGEGSVMSWKSKKEGNGVMTIMETQKYKSIHTKLDFEGQGTSYSDWIFVEDSNKTTKVSWTMDIENLKYPVGRIMGMVMNSMIMKSFEKGLAKLKKVSEDYFKVSSVYKTSDIKVEEQPMQYALVIKDSSKCDDVDILLGKLYGEIGRYIGENKIDVAGHPFARYYVWDEKADKNVMEAGFFIKNKVAGNDKIKCIELPAGKVVTAINYGAYETVYNTHNAIHKYLEDNKLTSIGCPLEIYTNDPEKEKDMTKWETEVIYPVK